MKKMFVSIAISVLFAVGLGYYVREKRRKRASEQNQKSFILGLPHFAPLNSGRMQRNVTSSGAVCRWGKLIVHVDEKPQEFKDVKVWIGFRNAQAKEWDWKKTGTQHVPGIQPADLEDFINQVDEVILTRGVERILQVPQATIDYVQSKGKKCHVGDTPDMIELFNRLADQGKKVGGVFH